ncbi:S26 family signal peptidase [Phyllobacterium sp. SB3]|uniref:S26 family signal peptidase n=1 Tax=Phyllobacterium sp. SB3 TaxID=3156073 RepID=UPI0032AEB8BE
MVRRVSGEPDPSEQIGLWRIVTMDRPVENGDLVFVCPPVTASFHKARERSYRGRGLWRGGFAPQIKSVVATSGQYIEIGTHVVVHGTFLTGSTVRTSDGEAPTNSAGSASCRTVIFREPI